MWFQGQAKRKKGGRGECSGGSTEAQQRNSQARGLSGKEGRGREAVGGEEHCWSSFVDVHEMRPHHSHPRAVARALPRPGSVLPRMCSQEALQGEPRKGEKSRRGSASELLLCAGPRARQFTDSISFNHHNNRVRKESRLPVSSEEMEAQSKTIFPS